MPETSLDFFDFSWLSTPEGWLSLGTLIFLEVVLGIDNVIFISILAAKLPEEQRPMARRVGLGGALVLRILLLATISWIMALDDPLFSLDPGWLGIEAQSVAITWKGIILLAGGLFLIAKATTEIHGQLEGGHGEAKAGPGAAAVSFGAVIAQIMLLDLVFSIDSVITAVGMAHYITIMVIAVMLTIALMMIAAGPVAHFIERNPTAKMLALSFLVLIGVTLVAEGLGAHIPKGYIYFAILFSIGVEVLNTLVRQRRRRRAAQGAATDLPPGAGAA